MKELFEESLSKVNNEKDKGVLKRKLKDILVTKTTNKDRKSEARNYKDLIRGRIRLNKVIRIERTNYINSIYGKTGDLTIETIHKLLIEGECDAWFSLIKQHIQDMQVSVDAIRVRNRLIDNLNQVITNFRDNDYDYESNKSHIHRELTKFTQQIKKDTKIIDNLKVGQSTKLSDFVERFRSYLNQIMQKRKG